MSIVAAVYNHVKFSIKRKETFKDMVVLLDVDIVKFHRNFDIGWLSLGECLRVLLQTYEPLMVMLSLEKTGDPTTTSLFQQLTSYRYLALHGRRVRSDKSSQQTISVSRYRCLLRHNQEFGKLLCMQSLLPPLIDMKSYYL